jgi:hypothetical protein
MGADLEHHAREGPARALALEGGGGRPYPAGADDLSLSVEDTIAAGGIAEIKTDG